MTVAVTFLILAAAVMHAIWNAFIKRAADKVAMATLIYGSGLIVAIPGIILFPFPLLEIWQLIFVHAFCHLIYKMALVAMYEEGDLSQVYPTTRGIAPLITTLLAIPIIGEVPNLQQIGSIIVICLGLLIFVFEPGTFSRKRIWPLVLSGVAGIALSIYTIADTIAIRLPEARFAFIAWIFLFDALTMFVLAYFRRGNRLAGLLVAEWKIGISCGIAAFLNFGIVLWALSITQIGHVVALRETSVVFAALIGTFFMKERFGNRRIIASIVIAGGIIVMHCAAAG